MHTRMGVLRPFRIFVKLVRNINVYSSKLRVKEVSQYRRSSSGIRTPSIQTYLAVAHILSSKESQGDWYQVFIRYLFFICYTITIITKRCQKKKCSKRWRGGLKETIELLLIRPPQLQFFEDGIKITDCSQSIRKCSGKQENDTRKSCLDLQ